MNTLCLWLVVVAVIAVEGKKQDESTTEGFPSKLYPELLKLAMKEYQNKKFERFAELITEVGGSAFLYEFFQDS